MNSVPRITTQQFMAADNAGISEIEMSNTLRQSGGTGMRSWFSGRSERRQSRQGSLSSSGSGPKTPVQEMSRIEAILTEVPLNSISSTSGRSSRHSTTSPISPISPLDRSGADLFSTNSSRGMPTMPEAAARRTSQQAMEEIIHSVQRLQTGRLEETRIPDAEAQQRAPREPAQGRKWWWQKPRWKGLQNRLITATIAGIMCTFMLIIYLGLALSLKYRLRQEWHVFMVLIILMTTLFFCHSLVRLGIDLTTTERSRNGSIDFSRVPSIAGSGGYANPRTPIRINTQSPQFNEGMKEPPPVYGLWRCSVRVNPDEFYWVRRRSATPNSPHPIPEEVASPVQRRSMTFSPRPPSYLSDDGVSYVVNAVPEIRTEPPLSPHLPELRRIA